MDKLKHRLDIVGIQAQTPLHKGDLCNDDLLNHAVGSPRSQMKTHLLISFHTNNSNSS